ncbi:MAG: outer membrane lipoprotein carrier protein LolA [Proteobacteria bacterium]|nr:outer membrane lipoprotein carrier protein LolA [Pseudomonadota bacterium]
MLLAPLTLLAAWSDPPLEALMRRLAAVQAAEATFTERKTLAALTAPVVTHGRLVWRRPSYLAKITDPPDAETLVADGDRLTVTEGEAAPRMLDLSAEPGLRALVDAVRGTLAGDLAALSASYAVALAGDPAAWSLILTPRSAEVSRYLTRAVLGGTEAALRSVEFAQANGDVSVMTITPLGAP